MAVKRTALAFESNFTRVPNEWLRDRRLSRRARGLLAELMTHTVGWEITTESLIEGGTEGRDAILKAVAELEAYGYLTRMQARKGGKFQGVDYTITDPAARAAESPRPENPVTVENSPCPENPKPPCPEKPYTAKPKQRRTSSLEDHLLEDHSVSADALTGGEGLTTEALPMEIPAAPAVTVAKADSPATPEEWVAKRAYDNTSGALNFMAIKGIAKWAIHTKGCHPRAVDDAVGTLYRRGRAVTKQTVAQFLDGIITPDGRANQPARSTTDDRVTGALALLNTPPSNDPFRLEITS